MDDLLEADKQVAPGDEAMSHQGHQRQAHQPLDMNRHRAFQQVLKVALNGEFDLA